MPHIITELCIGCTLCVKVCPVNAIDGKLKELHIINKKRCVDCGVCGKNCAKGAVLNQNGDTVAKVPKSEWKKPVVDPVLCSACSMCVDICKFDCLKISMPAFRGDIDVNAYLDNPKACVECGLCEKICPLHAIVLTEVISE